MRSPLAWAPMMNWLITMVDKGSERRVSASPRHRRSSRPQKVPTTSVLGTFTAAGGQPLLSSLTLVQGDLSVKADLAADHIGLQLRTLQGEYCLKTGLEFQSSWMSTSRLFLLLNLLRFGVHGAEAPVVEGSLPPPSELHRITQALAGFSNPGMVVGKGNRELGRQSEHTIACVKIALRRATIRLCFWHGSVKLTYRSGRISQ
jgi:hypothetical protein